MFSSKSFVITVALQLFRTFNLFGLPYVAALLFRARVPWLFCLFIVSPANPYEVAQYTLDHVVSGSSPDLYEEGNTTSPLIPSHEQARQHFLSPTVNERLQFEQRGIMSGKKTNLR